MIASSPVLAWMVIELDITLPKQHYAPTLPITNQTKKEQKASRKTSTAENSYPGGISRRTSFPFLPLSGLGSFSCLLAISVQFASSTDIYSCQLSGTDSSLGSGRNSGFYCSTTPKLRKRNVFDKHHVDGSWERKEEMVESVDYKKNMEFPVEHIYMYI